MRNTNGHLVVPSWLIKLNTEKNKDEIQYRYYATTTSTTKQLYIYIYMDHSSKSLGSNHGGETRKESIMQVILLLQLTES